jgi:hypothetical protein
VERYQDENDKQQMMENMIMKLQVMMDEARKRQQQQDENNMLMFHIVGYLNQKEVVSGLSETNKLYSSLVRNRYGIGIKMCPDEVGRRFTLKEMKD